MELLLSRWVLLYPYKRTVFPRRAQVGWGDCLHEEVWLVCWLGQQQVWLQPVAASASHSCPRRLWARGETRKSVWQEAARGGDRDTGVWIGWRWVCYGVMKSHGGGTTLWKFMAWDVGSRGQWGQGIVSTFILRSRDLSGVHQTCPARIDLRSRTLF